MYSLLRNITLGRVLVSEAAPLAASITIAELLFRFHSFTLELLAFIPTWYLASRTYAWVLEKLLKAGAPSA